MSTAKTSPQLKRLVVIANLSRAGVHEAVEKIVEWCEKRRIFTCIDARSPQPGGPAGTHVWPLNDQGLANRCEEADAAVCLGGDGTLLFAARILAGTNVPLLAVNMGSVGFHTQADPATLFTRLEDLAEGRFQIEPRMMLQAQVLGTAQQVVVLNDVVVNKPDWGHMIHVRVEVDGVPVSDVDADSLVVSTPTGSSGYNFAAGGPVLAPSMKAMVIQAICPHRSRFSPVVLEPDATVDVVIRSKHAEDEVLMLADGHAWLRATNCQRIRITRAPCELNLVTFEAQFWRQMRDKLRWGALNT